MVDSDDGILSTSTNVTFPTNGGEGQTTNYQLSTLLFPLPICPIILILPPRDYMLQSVALGILSAAAPVAGPTFGPVLILLLCAVAGIATVLMLPSRMESPVRKLGGVVILTAGLIFAALLVRKSVGQATAGGINVYFWIFSAIAVVAAVRVITHPRPIYSALYFVLTVFASAGLFVLLWAEFMAAALVLIYAGAILITYLFVIMLAAQAGPPGADKQFGGLIEYDAVSREPLAASAIGFVLMGLLIFVVFDRAQRLAPPTGEGTLATTADLGRYIFDKQLINLELAGLILTLAMVGAIAIARRRIPGQACEEIESAGVVLGPAMPGEDNPHAIPVVGKK